MLRVLLISLALTGATVLIHGIGTLSTLLRMAGIWKKEDYAQKALAMELLIMRLAGWLLVLHLTEAGLWGAFYCIYGLLPTFETALYFSMTSFATLGYGDVVLSGPLRLLGPIEALVGVLMMGWSTGIIVAAILKAYINRLNFMLDQTTKNIKE